MNKGVSDRAEAVAALRSTGWSEAEVQEFLGPDAEERKAYAGTLPGAAGDLYKGYAVITNLHEDEWTVLVPVKKIELQPRREEAPKPKRKSLGF